MANVDLLYKSFLFQFGQLECGILCCLVFEGVVIFYIKKHVFHKLDLKTILNPEKMFFKSCLNACVKE